jgi:RNA polymerase sigma-70 factor (ECF subfamily)
MKPFISKKERFYVELISSMRKPLTKYVESRIPDSGDSEDIVQEVFETAWLKIDELMKHENPRGWLFIAVKLHIKTYYGKLQFNDDGIIQNTEISELDLPVETEFDEGISFSDKLSSDELTIIKLKEQGFKHHEIAKIMKLSPGTIASKVSRIKAKLAEYWEGEKV